MTQRKKTKAVSNAPSRRARKAHRGQSAKVARRRWPRLISIGSNHGPDERDLVLKFERKPLVREWLFIMDHINGKRRA